MKQILLEHIYLVLFVEVAASQRCTAPHWACKVSVFHPSLTKCKDLLNISNQHINVFFFKCQNSEVRLKRGGQQQSPDEGPVQRELPVFELKCRSFMNLTLNIKSVSSLLICPQPFEQIFFLYFLHWMTGEMSLPQRKPQLLTTCINRLCSHHQRLSFHLDSRFLICPHTTFLSHSPLLVSLSHSQWDYFPFCQLLQPCITWF